MTLKVESWLGGWIPGVRLAADAKVFMQTAHTVDAPGVNNLAEAIVHTSHSWSRNGPKQIGREIRIGTESAGHNLNRGLHHLGISARIAASRLKGAGRVFAIDAVRLLYPLLVILVFLATIVGLVSLYSSVLVNDLSQYLPKVVVFLALLLAITATGQWLWSGVVKRLALQDLSQQMTERVTELQDEVKRHTGMLEDAARAITECLSMADGDPRSPLHLAPNNDGQVGCVRRRPSAAAAAATDSDSTSSSVPAATVTAVPGDVVTDTVTVTPRTGFLTTVMTSWTRSAPSITPPDTLTDLSQKHRDFTLDLFARLHHIRAALQCAVTETGIQAETEENQQHLGRTTLPHME